MELLSSEQSGTAGKFGPVLGVGDMDVVLELLGSWCVEVEERVKYVCSTIVVVIVYGGIGALYSCPRTSPERKIDRAMKKYIADLAS